MHSQVHVCIEGMVHGSNCCTMVARSRQKAVLAPIVLLMSSAEFTERRKVVKDSLGGRQASNSPHFSCQVSSTRKRDHEHFHTPRHMTFWRAFTSLLSEERLST